MGWRPGKGVVVAQTPDEAMDTISAFMDEGSLGAPVKKLVIEEYLEGPEVSLLALTDGETVLPLSPACDHKRIGDGDTGPNTGGMGVYSPTTLIDEAEVRRLTKQVLLPVVERMAKKDSAFSGILYAG